MPRSSSRRSPRDARSSRLYAALVRRRRGSHGVVWIEPRAVVDVQYNEIMQGRLRDAVL